MKGYEYRAQIADAGSKVHVVSGVVENVGGEQIAGPITGDDAQIYVPRAFAGKRAFIRMLMPRRGLLESVKVLHMSGSAPSFTVAIYEKANEGMALWNAIFESSTVRVEDTEVATFYEYPYGSYQYGETYAEIETKTINILEATGLMAPFQNRETTDESEGALYLAIIPSDTSTDNVFRFRVATVAFA